MPRLLATLIAAGVCATFGAAGPAFAEGSVGNQDARPLRNSNDGAVAMRLRLPFGAGDTGRDWRRGASLSLRLSLTDTSDQRGLDLISYRFAAGDAAIEGPFGRYGYDDDHRPGAPSHRRLLIAAGLSLAVGAIVANWIHDEDALSQIDDV